MARVQIPLPALAEQRRIAAILDRVDTIRARHKQAGVLANRLAAGRFIDLFGHPLTAPRWPMRQLGDLAVLRRGASPRPIEKYMGGAIPWIRIGDATATRGLYIERTAEFVTEAGAEKSVMLAPGSIIVANSGVSLGFARILRIAGCIHDGWLSIENLDPAVRPEFLVSTVNLMTTHLRRNAPTGTQPNLNIAIASRLPIPLPPLAQQDSFIAFLAAAGRLSDSIGTGAQAANQLSSSLTRVCLSAS